MPGVVGLRYAQSNLRGLTSLTTDIERETPLRGVLSLTLGKLQGITPLRGVLSLGIPSRTMNNKYQAPILKAKNCFRKNAITATSCKNGLSIQRQLTPIYENRVNHRNLRPVV